MPLALSVSVLETVPKIFLSEEEGKYPTYQDSPSLTQNKSADYILTSPHGVDGSSSESNGGDSSPKLNHVHFASHCDQSNNLINEVGYVHLCPCSTVTTTNISQ